jgi:hypothetical protein
MAAVVQKNQEEIQIQCELHMKMKWYSGIIACLVPLDNSPCITLI